jgi:Leucine-rich repeat (LRR) protein
MMISIDKNEEYDTGIHPDVKNIRFMREVVGDFFEGNRFPNLTYIVFNTSRLTKLKLNCLSVEQLDCSHSQLTKLELNCPSLQELYCSNCRLTKLELNCPFLSILHCFNNPITNLNGLEFCENLLQLICSAQLKESVKNLVKFIPKLEAVYVDEDEDEDEF